MKAARIICLCLFAVSVANAQGKRLKEFNIGCRGWSTLAFAEQKSEVKDLEPLGIDGVEVRVTAHEFSDEQIVFLESCDPKSADKPKVADKRYGRQASVVRGFLSYEIKGRVFAYRFTCFLVMSKNGQVTERFGAAGTVYYIDEDGDGTFERYRGAMPLRFLPDWVKASALKQ